MNNIAGVIFLAKTDLKKRKNPGVIFLDVKAALDNVLADLLLNKLKKIGVSMNLLALIQALFMQKSPLLHF